MINFQAIEKWFGGKSLAAIREYAIPTLTLAERDGFWPKGASRKVTAALNKQTVAIKLARKHERFLDSISTDAATLYAGARGWDLCHAMRFGLIGHVPTLPATIAALRTDKVRLYDRDLRVVQGRKLTSAERVQLDGFLDSAALWCADFAPVTELVALLDRSRPPLTIRVHKTLSRSVADNLGAAMAIQLDTIETPPIEWTWEEITMMIGGREAKVRMRIGTIQWPAGTLHSRSRHARKDSNCHACGHRISNPHNWIPLVGATPSGPVSLWVGRDCAKSLFGCEIEGEGSFASNPGSAE